MESPRRMNLALAMTVIGALIGGLLASWLSPKVIAWYFRPPAQIGLNCSEPIEWALGKMQVALGVGIVAGAVAGIVLYSVFARRRSAKAAGATPSK